MPQGPDLSSAIAELDDGYLQVQLLLAVRRAGSEQPRRAGLWHALAGLLAEEQQQRRQSAGLTGESADDAQLAEEARLAVQDVREELRRDAEAIEGEYAETTGQFTAPAGQAPLVEPGGPGDAPTPPPAG